MRDDARQRGSSGRGAVERDAAGSDRPENKRLSISDTQDVEVNMNKSYKSAKFKCARSALYARVRTRAKCIMSSCVNALEVRRVRAC